jgi:thioredoxin reductase (NADPH)
MCRREEVVIVGGGNSAGQAAVFLADYASKIYMLVRGKSLHETMSRYLIDRINATANIEVLTQTELVALAGPKESHLERVRWKHNPTGQETEKPIRNVFLFIGADPATEWLRDCGVILDGKGFVLTGAQTAEGERPGTGPARRPMSLETNKPGVFAVGDIRAGSVKRVGAAIGEGAAVVPQLHAFLTDTVQLLPEYATSNAKQTVAA